MPRGDGTGPAGLGPMTGRAAGYCAGYSGPGYANPLLGRGAYPYRPAYTSISYGAWPRWGLRRFWGRGRGWGGRGRRW